MTSSIVSSSSAPSLAQSQRPPPKSSSERGRTFRARQRQREAALATHVRALREHILALQRSRLLRLEALTRGRHTLESPDVRTIRELFTLCQDGLGDPTSSTTPHDAHQVRFKESYMRYVYDPDVMLAHASGVDTAIQQWRLYTVLHERFHVAMDHIDVVGDPDHPTYHLHAKLTVQIARRTFERVFPHVLADEAVVQKFLHRQIDYNCVVWLRFNDAGRIDFYGVNVNFIDGLLRAGGTVDEVARLLEHALITPHCTFRDMARDDRHDDDGDSASPHTSSARIEGLTIDDHARAGNYDVDNQLSHDRKKR